MRYERMTDAFPELATSRLRLRALTEDDAPAYRALLHLPQVTRFGDIAVADEAQALKSVTMMELLLPDKVAPGS